MTKPISTRAHGMIDFAYAAALIAIPLVLRWRGRAAQMAIGTGLATVGSSLLTRYELGLVPVIPMRGHLLIDAVESSFLMSAPRLLGTEDADAGRILAAFGLAGAMVGSLTQTTSPLEHEQRQLRLGFACDPRDAHDVREAPSPQRASYRVMHLHAATWVSLPRTQVFPFFADAVNLQRLTPPWLRFNIRTAGPIEMRAGTRIEYRISLHGLPMTWVTDITAFEPPDVFVDEQRRGPYRTWVHTHRFVDERGGTRLIDDVEFDALGGRLVAPLIAFDLRRIFTYRHRALLAHFEQPQPWPEPDITIRR